MNLNNLKMKWRKKRKEDGVCREGMGKGETEKTYVLARSSGGEMPMQGIRATAVWGFTRNNSAGLKKEKRKKKQRNGRYLRWKRDERKRWIRKTNSIR